MSDVSIEYAVATTSRWTFTMPPVKKLLREEMGEDEVWLDPMAGFHSPAVVTNDLNKKALVDFHEDALEFLKWQPDEFYDGVLFDPPYSHSNSNNIYKQKYENHQKFLKYLFQCRGEIRRILKVNGKVIIFGYNSYGMGKTRGFRVYRVLLVNHRNPLYYDTIVSCSRKVQGVLV